MALRPASPSLELTLTRCLFDRNHQHWGSRQRSPRRAISGQLFEHGDIVGTDTAGRTIIQLPVDDWVLEKLMTFDVEAADLEDGGDDEPDVDDEEDGAPVGVELARPKVIRRRRARSGA
jgi:hypothetical protein